MSDMSDMWHVLRSSEVDSEITGFHFHSSLSPGEWVPASRADPLATEVGVGLGSASPQQLLASSSADTPLSTPRSLKRGLTLTNLLPGIHNT